MSFRRKPESRFLFFTVKSISNALDPGFRRGDENPNPAVSKFNNLRAYLSAYGVYPRPILNANWSKTYGTYADYGRFPALPLYGSRPSMARKAYEHFQSTAG